jgi:AbrB family looped-hinge helix DNA binding protein
MTKEKVELLTRIGPKGQIVLRKEIRGALGLKPGSLVKEKIVRGKILLEPFDWEEEMERVEKIAKAIGKKWPKGLTSVNVIREERR